MACRLTLRRSEFCLQAVTVEQTMSGRLKAELQTVCRAPAVIKALTAAAFRHGARRAFSELAIQTIISPAPGCGCAGSMVRVV